MPSDDTYNEHQNDERDQNVEDAHELATTTDGPETDIADSKVLFPRISLDTDSSFC